MVVPQLDLELLLTYIKIIVDKLKKWFLQKIKVRQ